MRADSDSSVCRGAFPQSDYKRLLEQLADTNLPNVSAAITDCQAGECTFGALLTSVLGRTLGALALECTKVGWTIQLCCSHDFSPDAAQQTSPKLQIRAASRETAPSAATRSA